MANSGNLDVTTQVNGESRLFYLDTGATDTTMDKSAVERSNLPTVPSGRLISGVGGKTEELPRIVMDRLSVGGVEMKVNVLVKDMSNQHKTRIAAKDPLPDGWLGSDFMAPTGAIIDFGSTTLFLRLAASTASAKEIASQVPANVHLAACLKAQGYQEIPLLPYKQKLLGVEVHIGGQRARFMVDTGAQASIIDQAAAERLHLLAEPSTTPIRGSVDSGTTSKKSRIPEFSLGSIRTSLDTYLDNLFVINAALQQDGDAPFDGILGAPLLRQFAAVIDYGSAKLFLREP
ncbi:MAG TPA: retropepsin-like aspartic protease [Gemmataceae bacterium]|nr:retropepsin-like aspartic protease [Gemmataceae bacterium]